MQKMDPNNQKPSNQNQNNIPVEPMLETGPAASISLENAFENNGIPISQYSRSYFGNLSQDNNTKMSATEPLIAPDPVVKPDPALEALKAPIKPAAPVPGSIGSAVSIPNQNISQNKEQTIVQPKTTTDKKKSRNKTIIYIALGAVILAIMTIVVVLLISNGQNNKRPVKSDAQPAKTIVYTTLDCKYPYGEPDLLKISNAESATGYIHAIFGDGKLSEIEQRIVATFDNSALASAAKTELRDNYVKKFKDLGYSTDPFTSNYYSDDNSVEISHSADIGDITEDNRLIFNITIAKDNTMDVSQKTIKKTYESFGYTCEILED